jgi:hypothetical protein
MRRPVPDDGALVQLGTRIPRRIASDLKRHCDANALPVQNFVRAALEERLARVQRSLRRSS